MTKAQIVDHWHATDAPEKGTLAYMLAEIRHTATAGLAVLDCLLPNDVKNEGMTDLERIIEICLPDYPENDWI